MGRRKGRRARREGGRRAGPPPAFSGKLSSQGSPVPEHRITAAPRCHANSSWGWGEERGLQDPTGRGKFPFLRLSPPRPLGFPPASPLRTSLSFRRPGGGPASSPATVLGSPHCPQGITEGTAVKAPGERPFQFLAFRAQPVCKWRPSELPPTDSRPKRARSPLGVSPLASSSFCARWGGGR